MKELAGLLSRRLQLLGPVVEKALALRSAVGVEVPGQAEHNALIKSYVEACWVWGHTHGLEEMERFNRRMVQFNDPPKPDNRGPAPAEAIKWAEQRVALQGNWHRSLDAQVTQAIVTGLETGATNKDVMGALGRIFPTFSKLRLENIARTESVSAYNQGRLTAFRSNRYVVAVQFASILDSRTTKICRARDGMIMRMEDDRLPANTPPLHFMCRSTIVPVDKFDFEDLQNGVEAVEKQYFGWLDKSGPQSLTQATSAWDETPKPLPGFGSVQDIGKSTVKPALNPGGTADHPMTSRDGGTGYPIYPTSAQTSSGHVDIGGVKVPVVDHWVGKKEIETVKNALESFSPDNLKGLRGILFSNNWIRSKTSDNFSNARYTRKSKVVILSRSAARNWSIDGINTPDNLALAIKTIHHEVAHHIWFQGGKSVEMEWTKAFLEDGLETRRRDIWEIFANQVADYLTSKVNYKKSFPNIGKLFERIL